MWRIQTASYNVIRTNIIRTNKDKLRNFSLKAFPGENVRTMCNAIIERYTLVEALSDIEPDTLVALARSFETGTDESFRILALINTNEWKKKARALRYMDSAQILHYSDVATWSKRHFDIRSELRFYTNLYSELVHEGKYTPLLKPAANLLKQKDLEATKQDAGSKKLEEKKANAQPPKHAKAPTKLQTRDERTALNKTHCNSCGKSKSSCKDPKACARCKVHGLQGSASVSSQTQRPQRQACSTQASRRFGQQQ